jgi:hypothetical protein
LIGRILVSFNGGGKGEIYIEMWQPSHVFLAFI